MREMGGQLESRAFSIHSRFQRASSSSSMSSAYISCLPMRVPSYWSVMPLKNEGARLSLLSNVEPRVTCMPGLLGSDLISSMGLGVVVTTERGCRPRRSANERLSQVCGAYSHDASSSHHAASNWGPLSWSGSWLENASAKAPLGQVSFRLEGS